MSTPSSIVEAVARFEAGSFAADACREAALRFAPALFRARLCAAVDAAMNRPA